VTNQVEELGHCLALEYNKIVANCAGLHISFLLPWEDRNDEKLISTNFV
jgi:hypothetical protein